MDGTAQDPGQRWKRVRVAAAATGQPAADRIARQVACKQAVDDDSLLVPIEPYALEH